MTAAEIVVRPARTADADQWADLYRAYRAFYQLEFDEQVVNRVWAWVADPLHEVNSMVAVNGVELVGLANHRRFARPSSGSVGLYLDDLFTASTARGLGVASALLEALSQLAVRDGLSVVRWITATDNHRARRLYDRTASLTKWVTYDLFPGGPS
ncbi:MAG: GNAT family N-acetyltransferase [Nakamurella sp.]